MMKRALLVAFLALSTAHLFAQEAAISAPYVSRLRTSAEGSYIKLLWADSNLPGAQYVIYRSTQPIDAANFATAQRIATVPAGQESYIDQPPPGGPYYYAVLVLDEQGKLRELFIPFRNITSVGVSPGAAADQGPQYASVTGIEAKLAGAEVDLSFRSSLADHELLIYRATAPIRTQQDLASAVTVGDVPGSATSFADTPVAGIPYYYAVVDSAMLRNGAVSLLAGQNTTLAPVEVPLKPGAGPVTYAPARPRPLPLLHLSSNLTTGTPLPPSSLAPAPERSELSQSAQAAVASLLGTMPASRQPKLTLSVLDPEKGVVAQTGEEIALKAIVEGPLASGKWASAEQQLEDYLNIRRPASVEQRARYYLGQAYYFQGHYRRAFLEFLIAQQGLYTQVQPWMNAIFERLHSQGS